MNKTIIIGRVGANAETKKLENGTVSNFNVAVNEKYKTKDGEKKEKTVWFDCSLWNNENIANYIVKGMQVCIEGKVSAESYTDKEGHLKTNLMLNVQNLEMLDAAK